MTFFIVLLLQYGQKTFPQTMASFHVFSLGFTRHNSYWREDLTKNSVGLYWQT